MSHWQDKYFDRGRARRTRPESAPRPTVRSFAMSEWLKQIEADERMSALQSRALAVESREKFAQERHDAVGRLVARFGAEAVETLSRRVDPDFELPPDLRPPKTTTARARKAQRSLKHAND
jgi:hypothetical protein